MLNSCEEHGDCIVVHDSRNCCPFCDLVSEKEEADKVAASKINSLEYDVDALATQIQEMNDKGE